MEEMWKHFVAFLKEYDIPKITEFLRTMEWEEVLKNPVTWVVGLPIVAVLAFKKQFGVFVLTISLGLFIFLLQSTLPPAGQSIPLSKLLVFLGGSIALGSFNFYYFFIRKD